MCSTPFGITGFGTPKYCDRGIAVALVLNAFRHHWIRHKTAGSRRARRSCAQRLSASLDSARGYNRQPDGPQLVLNAFRHHWIRHRVSMSSGSRRRECSTPFGITGFGTGTVSGYCSSSAVCSTPFGITGFGTQHWLKVPVSPVASAQRLSASLDSAPYRPCRPPDRSIVLNAFRHHWIRHWPTACASRTCVTRAQRLSASLDSAPTRGSRRTDMTWCEVLNAFRHHWIRHSASW